MQFNGAFGAALAFAVLFAGLTFGNSDSRVAQATSRTERFETAVKALEECRMNRDADCSTLEGAVKNLSMG